MRPVLPQPQVRSPIHTMSTCISSLLTSRVSSSLVSHISPLIYRLSLPASYLSFKSPRPRVPPCAPVCPCLLAPCTPVSPQGRDGVPPTPRRRSHAARCASLARLEVCRVCGCCLTSRHANPRPEGALMPLPPPHTAPRGGQQPHHPSPRASPSQTPLPLGALRGQRPAAAVGAAGAAGAPTDSAPTPTRANATAAPARLNATNATNATTHTAVPASGKRPARRRLVAPAPPPPFFHGRDPEPFR